MAKHRIEYMAVDELESAPRNSKDHDAALIDASISRFGFAESGLLDERTGKLAAGHGRRDRLREMQRTPGAVVPDGVLVKAGRWFMPVERGWASADDAEALAAGIAFNRIGEAGGWKSADLFADLSALAALPTQFDGLGFAMADLDALMMGGAAPAGEGAAPPRTLAERFVLPPFSVLDARRGPWQDRKRAWLARGFRSELGRPVNLLKMSEQAMTGYGGDGDRPNRSQPSVSGNDPAFYDKKTAAESRLGRVLSTEEFLADHYDFQTPFSGGTSIFDPVLCELAYQWFSGPGARVLDPFAGGSVRGLMAALVGRSYVGIDLRAEQVAENEKQAGDLLTNEPQPRWIVGDAVDARRLLRGEKKFDLLFSCPPYFDLEQYSDDPADLSNAGTYEQFEKEYAACLAATTTAMRADAFAVLVVGNVRDGDGILRDLVATTRVAMEACGWQFYNDAILVTAVGSLALRAARVFALRKLGRTHQYVCVFVRGDVAKAVAACGTVDVPSMEELLAAVGGALDPEVEGDIAAAAAED